MTPQSSLARGPSCNQQQLSNQISNQISNQESEINNLTRS
jgi:hypothetical protein